MNSIINCYKDKNLKIQIFNPMTWTRAISDLFKTILNIKLNQFN